MAALGNFVAGSVLSGSDNDVTTAFNEANPFGEGETFAQRARRRKSEREDFEGRAGVENQARISAEQRRIQRAKDKAEEELRRGEQLAGVQSLRKEARDRPGRKQLIGQTRRTRRATGRPQQIIGLS